MQLREEPVLPQPARKNSDAAAPFKNGNKHGIVRNVVAALILRRHDGRDEVLICQRKPDQAMALKWEFPGGKIEPDETPQQALARELDEELGITASIGPRITQLRHHYRNGGAVDLQFFTVHFYIGELENRIFNDMRWAEFKDLPEYDFLAADLGFVRDLADGKFALANLI